MLIYKATIISTNKSYIGRTVNSCKTRWYNHCTPSRNDCFFHRAIRKYGKENIKWQILEDDINDFQYLKERQIFNIIKYDTYRPNGYNIILGGEGTFGFKHSQESKKKMRDKKLGRKLSKEIKEKMSESRKGKIFTQQHKKNMGIARHGQKHWRFGKKFSKQHTDKMSQSSNGRKLTQQHKRKIGARNKIKMTGRKGYFHHTEQSKNKMRLAKLGTKSSEQTKKKLSIAHTGIKLSDSHRRRQSQGKRNKKLSQTKVI